MADGQTTEVDGQAPAAEEDTKKNVGGARKRLMSGRVFLGQVVDWKGKYGWIQPAEPVLHQKAGLRQGRIFISRADLAGCRDLLPGVMVQFQLYEDDAGLGAQSCAIWDPMMAWKGGWGMPGKGFGKKGKGKGKGKGKDAKESAAGDSKSSTGPGPGSPEVAAPGQAASAGPAGKAPQPKAIAKGGKGEGGDAKGKGKGGRGKKGEAGGKAQAGKGGKGKEKGGKGKDEKGKGRGGNFDRNPVRSDRPAGIPPAGGFPSRPAAGSLPGGAGAPGGFPSSMPRSPLQPASPQVPQQLQQPPLSKMPPPPPGGPGFGLPMPNFVEGTSMNPMSMPQNLQNLGGLQGLNGLQGLHGLQGLQSLGLPNPAWAAFMPQSQPQLGPGAGLGPPSYPDLQDLQGLRAGAAQPPFRGGLAGASFFG